MAIDEEKRQKKLAKRAKKQKAKQKAMAWQKSHGMPDAVYLVTSSPDELQPSSWRIR